jgi:hypothetical protein
LQFASNLGHFLPTREETGVLWEIGEVEKSCFKTAKTPWMNQVNDEWDIFMFKQAHIAGRIILYLKK